MSHPSSRQAGRLRLDVLLLVIVVLAAGLRLLHVSAPYAEAHRWRQVMNADIARNFFRGPFDILHPRVSWGGTEEHVGIELPLYQALVAAVYGVVGEQEIVGRLLSIAFSCATVVLLYWLGLTCFGRGAGRGAALFFAVSPSAVFFGRTFLSDVPMLFFSVAAVLAYLRYLTTGRKALAVVGAIATALACLTKLSAVVILAPVVYQAWSLRRWTIWKDRWLWGGIGAALGVTVAWYWHAELIHQSTGLGVAVFSPAGGYGPAIEAFANSWEQPSIWSDSLLDGQIYLTLLTRAWSLHFTPLGVLCLAVGLTMGWRSGSGQFVVAWLLITVLEIVMTGPGQRDNEYYQLPLLLPAALFIGLALGHVLDVERASARGRLVSWAMAGSVVLAGWLSFAASGVVRDFFRPDRLDWNTISAGAAIDAVVEPDAMLIVVQHDQRGTNAPELLYRANRRGWSFDREAISEHLIERLRQLGAVYVAAPEWYWLIRQRPEIAEYLRRYRAVPTATLTNDVALFDLRVSVRTSARSARGRRGDESGHPRSDGRGLPARPAAQRVARWAAAGIAAAGSAVGLQLESR